MENFKTKIWPDCVRLYPCWLFVLPFIILITSPLDAQDRATLSIENLTTTSYNVSDSVSVSFSLVTNEPGIRETVNFYISTDTSSTKFWIGDMNIDSDYSSIDTFEILSLPSYIPPGIHLLTVEFYTSDTSDLDAIVTASTPVNILLTPADLTIPFIYIFNNQLNPGYLNTFQYFINKIGNASVDSATIEYYLSEDSLFDPGIDLQVGYLNRLLNFDYNPNEFFYDTIRIPENISEGNYFLICIIDRENNSEETNEENNIKFTSILLTHPNIDLEITGSNHYILNDTSIYVSVTSSITGSSKILIESSTGYYLSADTLLDQNSDEFVGSTSDTGSVDHNMLFSTFTFAKPINFPSGNYYIIVASDYLDEVTESNELNNIEVINMSSTIDLTFVNTMPSNPTITYTPGMKVTTFIKNAGTSTSNDSEVLYTLLDSQHNAIEYIGFVYGDPIQPLEIQERSMEIMLPYEGVFYIQATADYYNFVNEFDETNNVTEQKIIYFVITGNTEQSGTSEISIFPVPASETFTISNPNSEDFVNYSVFNNFGDQVWKAEKVSNENLKVQCDTWSKGIYYIRAETNGNITQKKLVIF